MTQDTIYIDCYGRSYFPVIESQVGEVTVFFIYDTKEKFGKPFSFSLFHNDAVKSRKYLRYPKKRRIGLLVESPLRKVLQEATQYASRYTRIFTHWESLYSRGDPFECLYVGTSWLGYDNDPSLQNRIFEKEKLLSFIGSILHGDEEGYRLRKEVANMLQKSGQVDCFGKGIKEIEGKIEGLAPYAFSVAMENIQENYYFTEKLIDCFLTDTVPVYWGCPGIGNIFDSRGLISFSTLDDLEGIIPTLNIDRYYDLLPYVKLNKELAIKNNWHTMKSLYKRLAERIVGDLEVTPTNIMFRTLIMDKTHQFLSSIKRFIRQ